MTSSAFHIRRAKLSDLEAITAIYNDAIRTGTATFDTEPKSDEEQLRWFESHGAQHPILVAEEDGLVLGWACLSKWSDRAAYDETAETSFYVARKYRGQGIGRALKQEIIAEGRRLGFRSLIAQVAQGSDESVHLNESLGFEHVGTLKGVGRKFGRLLDVYLMQKVLNWQRPSRPCPVQSHEDAE